MQCVTVSDGFMSLSAALALGIEKGCYLCALVMLVNKLPGAVNSKSLSVEQRVCYERVFGGIRIGGINLYEHLFINMTSQTTLQLLMTTIVINQTCSLSISKYKSFI